MAWCRSGHQPSTSLEERGKRNSHQLKAINFPQSKWGQAKSHTRDLPYSIRCIHPNDHGNPKNRGLHGRAATGPAFQVPLCNMLTAFLFPGLWVHHRSTHQQKQSHSWLLWPSQKVNRWAPVHYTATPNTLFATGTLQNRIQAMCFSSSLRASSQRALRCIKWCR